MSTAVYDELIRWVSTPSEDPETKARKRRAVQIFVETTPEVRDEFVGEGLDRGRLIEARSGLRRVLARRKLATSREEEARIDACVDLATLERWLDQAIDAKTANEALQ
jgi:hypothetical protein